MAAVNPRLWPRPLRLSVILLVSSAAFLLLFTRPRLPLGSNYHDFADKRTFWGLTNAQDALSNLPFLAVGLWGCAWLAGQAASRAFRDDRERLTYFVFFLGVAITGFGSFWYHLTPSNNRLPWDLLPMTCSFVAMLIATIMERISVRAGFLLLGPALLCGIGSVVYWYVSENRGHGDYKFYLFIQLFFPVLLALIVLLFPPAYTGLSRLVQAFLLFVAAKLLEAFDYQVYRFHHLVSGHALKHVVAALSCLWILRMLKTRHRYAEKDINPSASGSADMDWPTLARG